MNKGPEQLVLTGEMQIANSYGRGKRWTSPPRGWCPYSRSEQPQQEALEEKTNAKQGRPVEDSVHCRWGARGDSGGPSKTNSRVRYHPASPHLGISPKRWRSGCGRDACRPGSRQQHSPWMDRHGRGGVHSVGPREMGILSPSTTGMGPKDLIPQGASQAQKDKCSKISLTSGI